VPSSWLKKKLIKGPTLRAVCRNRSYASNIFARNLETTWHPCIGVDEYNKGKIFGPEVSSREKQFSADAGKNF
jgi:ribonuclease HIII